MASTASLLLKTLERSKDLNTAILAVAALDDALVTAITRHLVPGKPTQQLFRVGGPLGAISARNDLAFSIGFYGRKTHHDIESMNWIRNRFAHLVTVEGKRGSHSLVTFSYKPIADKCAGLHLPGTTIYEGPNRETGIHAMKVLKGDDIVTIDDPRDRFMSAFYLVWAFLSQWSRTDSDDMQPVEIRRGFNDGQFLS